MHSNSNTFMKLIYIILFLSAVVTNELVLDILLYHGDNISLCDNPIEHQPEKENQDVAENETEIDYFTTCQLFSHLIGTKVSTGVNHNCSLKLIPYLEIHSPPPELI